MKNFIFFTDAYMTVYLFEKNKYTSYKIILCILWCALTIILSGSSSSASSYDVIENLCPEAMSEENYRSVVKEFSYRMKDAVESYGCDVIPVYYAFEPNESIAMLDIIENSEDMMRSMTALFKKRPELAEAFHNNTKLILPLSQYLGDSNALSQYIDLLQTMTRQQYAVFSEPEKDSNILLARLLIPGLSALKLKKTFSPKEMELLIPLLALSHSWSDDQYLPALAALPNDSCDVYKMLLQEWGIEEMQKLIKLTPHAVTSILPPMTWREIAHLFPAGSYPTPERFRTMQQRYIQVQHMLYGETARHYSPAWGAEVCAALADALVQGLMEADFQQEKDIRRFLSWLVSDSLFFRDIVSVSPCQEISNITLFGILLAQPEKKHLGGLADWYAKGDLARLLNNWTRTTSPQKFAGIFTGDIPTSENIYLASMMSLSVKRRALPPEQQKLLDQLLTSLPGPEEPVWLAPTFLVSVGDTLFSIMQKRQFSRQYDVAIRLLQFGFPDSDSPSLYQYFCAGNPPESPDARKALLERGSLPEDTLLRSGLTIKGKLENVTGVDPIKALIYTSNVLDAIDIACQICSYIYPPARAGSAVAKIGTAMISRGIKKSVKIAGSRLAIRRVSMAGARQLVQGKAATVAAKGARNKGRTLPRRQPKSSPEGLDLDSILKLMEIYDMLQNAFGRESEKYMPDWSEVQLLCPGQTKNENTLKEMNL